MTLVQAMSEALQQAQTRAHTPAGVPIPSRLLFLQSSPHPPGDLRISPPMIVSQTMVSGGDGRTLEMRNKGPGHHVPSLTRGFIRSCLTDLI